MQTGFSFALGTPTSPRSDALEFTTLPAISPGSGLLGTTFNISFGQVDPQPDILTPVLSFNGQDVTADVQFGASGLVYTPPADSAAGPLVLDVRASGPSGVVSAPSVVVTVASEQTHITMGRVTFSLDGSYQSGYDAAGKAYVVVPPGQTATVVEVTPAQSLEDGAVANGMMKNPKRTDNSDPNQGYDERFSTYDDAKNQTLPVDVMAGDVLVKTIAHMPYEKRKGSFEEIAALHVVPQMLPQGAFLGPSVTWPGRTAPLWYEADIDAFYAATTRRSASGLSFPPFDVLMQSIDRFYPLYGQISSVASATGYQNFSPYNFGGGNGNYGAYIGSIIEAAMLSLTTDVYSETQSKALLRRLVQHGIEWGDPMLYGPEGNSHFPNGGHNQFHQGPVVLALAVTGRSGQAHLLMDRAPGNWGQAFQITPELHQQMTAHRELSGFSFSRIRSLGAQPGGGGVRLPYEQGFATHDWYQTHIPAGALMVRVSDGASAFVTEDTPFGVPDPSVGTFDVPIDGASPFVQGDEVYVQVPSDWVSVGMYDWTVRGPGIWTRYSPSAANQYRNLQNWGAIMALRSMGLLPANAHAAEGYLARSAQPAEPATGNDYPSVFAGFSGRDGVYYQVAQSYFDQHWAAIAAQ